MADRQLLVMNPDDPESIAAVGRAYDEMLDGLRDLHRAAADARKAADSDSKPADSPE